MSQTKAQLVSGTTAQDLTVDNINTTSINSGQTSGKKNIIINGAMQVAQRGTSATGKTATGVYATDRMNLTIGSAGTWTVSQDSDSPNEFAKSTKFQCTTANASLGTGAYLLLGYRFEGHDVQSLAKGTSSAKTFTVSFHVKSNKTGTYILGVNDRDNSRNNSKPYTIDVANTWEKKTITFEADTTGALDDDANESLRLDFWLGAGTDFTSGSAVTGWESTTNANRAKNLSVNLADNTANNFYITGVQLEVGSVATDFEHRSYGEELALCQRYCYRLADGTSKSLGLGINYSSSQMFCAVNFPVTMRSTPTLSAASGTNYYEFIRDNGTDWFNSLDLGNRTSTTVGELFNASEISGTSGHGGFVRTDNSAVFVDFVAEL